MCIQKQANIGCYTFNKGDKCKMLWRREEEEDDEEVRSWCNSSRSRYSKHRSIVTCGSQAAEIILSQNKPLPYVSETSGNMSNRPGISTLNSFFLCWCSLPLQTGTQHLKMEQSVKIVSQKHLRYKQPHSTRLTICSSSPVLLNLVFTHYSSGIQTEWRFINQANHIPLLALPPLLLETLDGEECVPPVSPRWPPFGGRGMSGMSAPRLFSQPRTSVLW